MVNFKQKISDHMVCCPHSVGLDQSVKIAQTLMRKYNIRHLPVQDGGSLVGILSDRDINFALAVDKTDPETLMVADVYTDEPLIVEPSADIARVAREMAERKLGCVLVAEEEKLTGIFTAVDACETLASVASD